MRAKYIFILAAFAWCLLIHQSAAVAQDSPDTADLGFNPRTHLQYLADMKARSSARQLELEKYYAPLAPTSLNDYDVTYYDIRWTPCYADQSIAGLVTVHARSTVDNLAIVPLHMDIALHVDSVYDDQGFLPSAHAGSLVQIYLHEPCAAGEEFSFTIRYSGQPVQPTQIFEGLMFEEFRDIPIIESLSEPYGARQWWPCKDVPWDKADSADIRITADTGMTATSNGILIDDIDNGDGTHTAHWSCRYPITTYLICIAVSRYEWYTDYYYYGDGDSMPIVNYVFPGWSQNPNLAYDITPTAITVFAGLFGEYPFIREKYGHTMSAVHGMEHQNNTFLNYYLSTLEETVVHELAHHWWGDMVTCASWPHIWLNEGFATYCEALFYEALNGPDHLHAYMNEIKYTGGGTLYVYDISDPWVIFDIRSYFKGAWMLHMLRHVVGDEAFFEGLRQYALAFAYGNADSDDFRMVMEDVSGLDLAAFFQQWLYGEYYPYYYYSFLSEQNDSGDWTTYLHIRQVHNFEPRVYTMPIDLRISTASGEDMVTVDNNRRAQSYTLTTDEEVQSILLDPEQWILRFAARETYSFHIVTEELQPPIQAEPYCDTIVVKGGFGAYTVRCVAGDFPNGWCLDSTCGTISGYCCESGEFTFTIVAKDAQVPTIFADTVTYTVVMGEPSPRPGDANADMAADVADAVYTINYVFKGGPVPPVINWADVNADCAVNVGDAVYLINYVFKGGPAPLMGCVE